MKLMWLLLCCVTIEAVVKTSVYYEALCPDSVNFIKDQFYPTWRELREKYLEPDFIPYGKASHHQNSGGKWEFQCQHGPEEGKGNMEQACALHVLKSNVTAKVEFINCVMSSRSPTKAGQQCASSLGIDYSTIQTCMNSSQGGQLLADFGDRTHSVKPTITFIPTVVFNGIYSKKDQDEVMRHFLRVVCRHIDGTKPDICSSEDTQKRALR